jgi:hypothetical protein
VSLGASGLGAALGLGALWLAVRGGISPRLRHSWDGYYLVLTSPHGFAHSVRDIVDGFVRGIGVTTPALGISGLGSLDRAAILVLFVLGLARWHRQLLSLSAIAAALVLSIPTLVPLGTGRTDAYLYPAAAMVLAEGAAVAWHAVRRFAPTLAVVVLAGSVALAGVLVADRVIHRPGYPGGNLRAVGLPAAGRPLVIVGGTARWPWAYYDDAGPVAIRFSTLYNNGYTVVSKDRNVLVIRGTPIEGGYRGQVAAAVARARGWCPGIVYVESNDWPSMPMTLLHALTTTAGLVVASGPLDAHGYRVWHLVPKLPCPMQPSG